MKCDTQTKIKIQEVPKKKIANHQQLVYNDTKLIFYDSQSPNNQNESKKLQNKTSVRKLSQPKISFNFARPKTGLTFSKQKNIRKPKQITASSSKQNISLKINIKQLRSSKLKSTMSNQPLSQTLSHKQNTRQSLKVNQQRQKKVSQFSLTHRKDANQNKQQSKYSKVHKSKTKQSKNQPSHHSTERTKNQTFLQTQRDKHKIQPQVQVFDHDAIKLLFGQFHSLFKTKRDYLIEDRLMNQMQKQKLNSCQLEQQIRMLSSPIKNLHKNIQNPSLFLGCNSKLFQNSFFSYPNTQRAPILRYIKNSQTKKLYNILISQNGNNFPDNKYKDQQFSYDNADTIKNKTIQWVYIKPTSQIKLFPNKQKTQQKESYCKANNKEFYQQLQEKSQKQPFFVTFLRFLYFSQPQMIQRLFEPVVNNVYSVWLFINGCYEPVFIDGYFPLDQKLNHYFGGCGQYLWLPILIKCICKIFNTFSYDKVEKISPKQIYKFLTGMQIQWMSTSSLQQKSDQQITRAIQHILNRSCTPMLCSQKKRLLEIMYIDEKQQISALCYNPFTQQTRNYRTDHSKQQYLLIIKPFFSWFAYSFNFNQACLNKFQLYCQRSVEVVFSVSLKLNQQAQTKKRLYIYESQQSVCKKNSIKTKLNLKQQIELKSSFKYKFKKGVYKIFVQQGEKKINFLLSGKSPPKEHQQTKRLGRFSLTLFTSSEVKVSDVQQLYKKGQFLQDSNNLYQDGNKNKSTSIL